MMPGFEHVKHVRARRLRNRSSSPGIKGKRHLCIGNAGRSEDEKSSNMGESPAVLASSGVITRSGSSRSGCKADIAREATLAPGDTNPSKVMKRKSVRSSGTSAVKKTRVSTKTVDSGLRDQRQNIPVSGPSTSGQTPGTSASSISLEPESVTMSKNSADRTAAPSFSSEACRKSGRGRKKKRQPPIEDVVPIRKKRALKKKGSLSTFSRKEGLASTCGDIPVDQSVMVDTPAVSAVDDFAAGPSSSSDDTKISTSGKTEVVSGEKVEMEETLMEAVAGGNVMGVEAILKETSAGSSDKEIEDDSAQGVLTTALFSAVRLGHKRVVQLLVKHGADVNAVDAEGMPVLHVAVESRFPDLVKFLVKRGARVSALCPAGDSVLMAAVKSRQPVDLVQFLIRSGGANVNDQDARGVTAAMICLGHFDFDMLKLLIDNKVNLNTVDNAGDTVFSLAASKNVRQMVELLTSVHSRKPSYLLLRAIKMNCVNTVSTLLDCDFMDRNVNSEKGPSPLNSALSKGRLANYKIVSELLYHGADLEKEDQDGNRPLSIAAASGRLDLVELLLSRGAKINAKGSLKNMTALMWAVKKGHMNVVECLIEHKANVNLRDDFACTALTYALGEGRLDCVQLLLAKKAQVHKAKDLQVAVVNGHTEVTKILLEVMNPRELNSGLLFSAVKDDCVEIAKLLIQYGADVNGVNTLRETPLMVARTRAMAVLLIDKGACVNYQSPFEGKTALMEAANSSNHVVSVLIERKANVNLTDSEGNTALILAALGNNPDAVQMLLAAGADGNLMNKRNLSALMAAAQRGLRLAAVRSLIKKGVDVNAKSAKDETALMYASRNRNYSIVRLLLAHGAKVNLQDLDGNSALMMSKTAPVGEMLMSAGAEVNLRNRDGKSALMLVLESISTDSSLVEGLIRNKAEVFVLNAQKTKSPLSSLLRKQVLLPSDYICLQELLKAGAARMGAPYHCPAAPLVKFILVDKPSIVQGWVTSGAPPAMVCNHCLVKERCCTTAVSTLLQCCGVSELSPFMMALVCGNLKIAQYLVDIWFLTPSDVNGPVMQKGIRKVLEKLNQPKSVEYLDQFFTEPPPLVRLCFFSVLQSVKSGPEREAYVRGTGLPQTLQDQLLFSPRNSKFSLEGPDSDYTSFAAVLNYRPHEV
ncbi:ankyrin-3 isoform X2 [Aplysia californica]|uniref:Ankyrin-3 isoform X2 n=1 Tax=Aplysia californica TaxID=6500 RepID=A0ABM1VP10_APLCA|nr:ankyrin-3 isoform X2 [Aplysia californica]